ncbi:serine/threonine-protein kinase AfsK-like, partial [Pyrgilauda ruficollis]|uniref:serine/threonine-protein kinase AfsK-like n=1 Tax=Pyrgilauda ruficollis TaxID=221976 RepID=UPI001B872E0D
MRIPIRGSRGWIWNPSGVPGVSRWSRAGTWASLRRRPGAARMTRAISARRSHAHSPLSPPLAPPTAEHCPYMVCDPAHQSAQPITALGPSPASARAAGSLPLPEVAVTAGPAAGFLLQALVAAADALSPRCPLAVAAVPPPGSWLCSVLSQPLVAFGCHRLSGDGATANVLLAAGTAVAALAAGWPRFVTAGHFVPAGHFVTALTAGSLLALAALTASVTGAVAAAL